VQPSLGASLVLGFTPFWRGSLELVLPAPVAAICRQGHPAPASEARTLRALPEPPRPTRRRLQGQWPLPVGGALGLYRRGPAPAAAPPANQTPSHKCLRSLAGSPAPGPSPCRLGQRPESWRSQLEAAGCNPITPTDLPRAWAPEIPAAAQRRRPHLGPAPT